MASFNDARTKLVNRCSHQEIRIETQGNAAEVHAVTFQPLAVRANQDRLSIQQFLIQGQEWLFLGVCDGHGGSSTSRYTASHLPSRVRAMLEHLVQTVLVGQLDRDSMVLKAEVVTSELRRCINDFDDEIGRTIEIICPFPADMSEATGRSLVREFPADIAQASAGTTLAAVLVNLTNRLMWAVNVGDSTVALSTASFWGKRTAQELCARHSIYDPREVRRIVSSHPKEKSVIKHGRLLGSLTITRAIGDFGFKLPAVYSSHLFRHLSILGPPRTRQSVIDRIISPPYVTADPSVHFVDLDPIWEQKPIIMVYSDGVDNLVQRCRYLSPWRPFDVTPSRVLAILLQDQIDRTAQDVLGYPLDPQWSGKIRNRALDVLGNLIGGTSTRILNMMTDQQLLADHHATPNLYIDDTTIVLCSFLDSPQDTASSQDLEYV